MPFVASVSAREPASIHTPTVAVCAWGCASVATVRPFERVDVSVNGPGVTAVASDRRGTCHHQKKEIFEHKRQKTNLYARFSALRHVANEQVL